MWKRLRLVLYAAAILWPALPSSSTHGQSFEWGIDRPGSDLRSLDLPKPDAALCQNACVGEGACLGWTYVKPNVQGPQARCWLKTAIAPATKNDCCISGRVRAAPGAAVGGGILSVRDSFEALQLLGTFAAVCHAPPGPQNHYIVFRTLDAAHVQIDTMVSMTERVDASVVDSVTSIGANEIGMSYANQSRRLINFLNIDGNRWRLMDSSDGTGARLVVNGRLVGSHPETNWHNKCR